MTVSQVVKELNKYVEQNPNLLNENEIKKLRDEFTRFVMRNNGTASEVLIEFFSWMGFIQNPEDEFLKHIVEKYPVADYKNILEVASGKTCSLGKKLKEAGYSVTSIDPNIRAKDEELQGITVIREKFDLDFNIDSYDCVIGYNACPVAATLLKVNKPSTFSICEAPEQEIPLDIGIEIKSKEEFMGELKRRGADIQEVGNLTIIDNSRILEKNKRMDEER